MLRSVRLKNFKLHEDTSIEASRITVFIGPNNSGKSSIFQALLALKQATKNFSNSSLVSGHGRKETSADQPFLYPVASDPVVDLGEFENVVRDPSHEVLIGVKVELSPPDATTDLVRKAGRFLVDFDIWFHANQLEGHRGTIACSLGETTPWSWHRKTGGVAQEATLMIPSGKLIVRPGERLNQPVQATVEAIHAPVPSGHAEDLAGIREAVDGLWRRLFDSFRPIYPIRGFEEWGYPTTEFPAHENLNRLVLSDRAVALTNLLAANARLRTQVSDRLKSLVGTGMEFETAPLRRVKVWATSEKTGRPETLFVNEGSGASQLPFILVPIALAKRGETILLSEPEAHLHPKAQSELTAMLLQVSRRADLQFFIETHSEHVLHRLLHAVGKGELAHDDLTIYYFENNQGKAEVRRLNLDEKGGVEGGLPGFFEQSLDELTEYLEALKQPKT